MIITNDMARCVALHKTNQFPSPVDPCTTCARYVNASSQRPNRPWITLPPAFWNGERYVCDKHMELRNEQKPD